MSAPRARPPWGRTEAEWGSVGGTDGHPTPSARDLGRQRWDGGRRTSPSTCRDFGARQLRGVRWHAGEGACECLWRLMTRGRW